MNGQASESEAFGSGVQGKVITPTEVSNSNAEWASSDAFSSTFDAFSNNKLENVSLRISYTELMWINKIIEKSILKIR